MTRLGRIEVALIVALTLVVARPAAAQTDCSMILSAIMDKTFALEDVVTEINTKGMTDNAASRKAACDRAAVALTPTYLSDARKFVSDHRACRPDIGNFSKFLDDWTGQIKGLAKLFCKPL
jgi:hypothetical protein